MSCLLCLNADNNRTVEITDNGKIQYMGDLKNWL